MSEGYAVRYVFKQSNAKKAFLRLKIELTRRLRWMNKNSDEAMSGEIMRLCRVKNISIDISTSEDYFLLEIEQSFKIYNLIR